MEGGLRRGEMGGGLREMEGGLRRGEMEAV